MRADLSLRGRHEVVGPRVRIEALISPEDQSFTKTFSLLSLFPKQAGARELVWRMSAYLGEDRAGVAQPDLLPELGGVPDYLLVHDSNIGFREQAHVWQRLLSPESPGGAGVVDKPRAIVMAALAPLAQGPLWERLITEFADRLTLVITGEDLRKEGVEVGYPLSWERVLINVVGAVKSHPISKASRVVVVLGAGGAVVIERDGPDFLVFDARHQEGDWVSGYPGVYWGFGLLPCLAASVFVEILRGDSPDIPAAAARGLAAARALHVEGFGSDPGARPDCDDLFQRLAAGVVSQTSEQQESSVFTRLEVPEVPPSDFNILVSSRSPDELMTMAYHAAVVGPGHLTAGIPVESVGSWVSVDRGEIESVRSVRNIIKEYVQNYRRGARLGRPLSIGVFGPPGAGKSFAVGEIAKTLLGGELTKLTFNLSQFQSPAELPQAFHRVRDLALEQRLPFVFWDEFDAHMGGNRLGWLSSFLEPMQDGVFRESGDIHPIGPAVFVFAGGTSATLQEFQSSTDPAADRAAKKLDFLSRLRGYLDILGPNPFDENDRVYPLRRAFVFRSMLLKKAPQIVRDGRLNVDEGVLRAFLAVDRFTHGARSMEAIIDQCSLAGKSLFARSCLPPEGQLALHVDPAEFLKLVRSS